MQKIFNKLLANRIQQFVKRIIYYNQNSGMQFCSNSQKSINVIYHITWSLQYRKSTGQNPYFIHVKTQQFRNRGGLPQLELKNLQNKSTANIIFGGKKLKVFELSTAIRQRCPFSPQLFYVLLEVLVNIITQEKEIKCI